MKYAFWTGKLEINFVAKTQHLTLIIFERDWFCCIQSILASNKNKMKNKTHLPNML